MSEATDQPAGPSRPVPHRSPEHRSPEHRNGAGGSPVPETTAERWPKLPAVAVWWALVGWVLGQVLGVLFSGLVYGATHNASGPATTLAGEVGLWSGWLGSCLYVSHRYGTGSMRRDFQLRFRRRDVAIGALAAVACLVASSVWEAVFAHTAFQGSNTQIITNQPRNTAGFAVITVLVALGAPFFEELFFRGLIRTTLAARLGPVGAVWGQAVLFGLAHIQEGTGLDRVSIFVVITTIGLVLGYAAHFTKRLAPGMVGHALYDSVVAALVLAG